MWRVGGPLTAVVGIVLAVEFAGGCAATHQARAQQFYQQGRLDEADYEIGQALADDPNNAAIQNLAAQIFTQRGVAHYQRGEMIAAANYFHRAIDYVPTYAPAYDYLGLIAFSQHNWQDAIRFGERAAGYSGQPPPGYVAQAQAELRRVRSGQLFVRRRHPKEKHDQAPYGGSEGRGIKMKDWKP
jgi:tetratricopeptide (TPR) repeat protein